MSLNAKAPVPPRRQTKNLRERIANLDWLAMETMETVEEEARALEAEKAGIRAARARHALEKGAEG